MKNNRIMYKFKGTINGVEYTNKKEFFEALKNLDPKLRYQVRIDEQDEQTPKSKGQTLRVDPAQKAMAEAPAVQRSSVQTTKGHENLFAQLLTGLVLSFMQAENPQLYKKFTNPIERAKVEARQEDKKPVEPKAGGVWGGFKALTHKYFFPETTYEFKGNAEDDWHLDRFSELLATRSKEIKSENLSRLTRDQLNVLYRRSLDEYARISNKINEIDTRLKEFDKSLAGLENIIKAYENVGLTVPQNIKVLFSDTKSGFDQLTNRKNYYLLLLEHYRNVGPYFDPAR